ncbi:ParB/RepB/Spo0J family partition protein [Sorangium sp. So ce233]|uniref:ParB/RepB/Spo0J family partition protein n=1 Tax=Sorangium sp. So ce233 TaxID=3133290 RepID=UPI003F62C7B1
MARRKPSPKNDPAAQRYEVVPIDSVREHPENPNEGDEEALDESEQENGFYGACVVQASTGLILAGNTRHRIAKRLGHTTIPVIWLDVDDERALKILLADNGTRQGARTQGRMVAEILKSLPTTAGTGYRPPQVEALLKAARPRLDYLEAMRAGGGEGTSEGADAGEGGEGEPFDAEDEGDGDEVDQAEASAAPSGGEPSGAPSKELPRHPLPIVLTNSEQRRWVAIKAKLGQSKDKPAFLSALEVLEQALS